MALSATLIKKKANEIIKIISPENLIKFFNLIKYFLKFSAYEHKRSCTNLKEQKSSPFIPD